MLKNKLNNTMKPINNIKSVVELMNIIKKCNEIHE